MPRIVSDRAWITSFVILWTIQTPFLTFRTLVFFCIVIKSRFARSACLLIFTIIAMFYIAFLTLLFVINIKTFDAHHTSIDIAIITMITAFKTSVIFCVKSRSTGFALHFILLYATVWAIINYSCATFTFTFLQIVMIITYCTLSSIIVIFITVIYVNLFANALLFVKLISSFTYSTFTIVSTILAIFLALLTLTIY